MYQNILRLRTVYGTVNVSSPGDSNVKDVILMVGTGAASQVNLPDSPSIGETYTIKDTTGSAATNNMAINTSPVQGNPIEDGTLNVSGGYTLTLATNYESVTLTWNGLMWMIIASHKYP